MTERKRHKTRFPGCYYRDTAKGKVYQVLYRDSEGRQRFETLPLGSLEQDAVNKQAEIRNKKAKGERVVRSTQTLREFSREWLDVQEGNLSQNTMNYYRYAVENHIVPLYGHRKLQDVTIDDVAALVAGMKRKGYKAWTIKGVLTPFGGIMGAAVRRGFVNSNPVKGLTRSERPKDDQRKMRILTSEEIQLVLQHSPERYRALLAFLVFTGFRIGEALSATWADVDFDSGLVTTRTAKTVAGSHREVVLMPELVSLLRKHKLASDFSQEHDLVFPSEKGTMLSRRNVLQRGLYKAIDNANKAMEAV
jgi:integrase